MIKILFSPSEKKNTGGIECKRDLLGAINARDEILDAYNRIVLCKDEEKIKTLFGIKKFTDCVPYVNNVLDSPLMCSIERYQGVAYDYIQYTSLTKLAQEYLKKNTIIFSNLYGPILGSDPIANYKVKQGNTIGDIIPDKFYKERFSYQLDLYLQNNDILDLRAGYYNKFYKLTQPYTILRFLKNGKTVSHWAKAYRGIVLAELAKNNITNINEFKNLKINGLSFLETKITKNKTEITYNIL
jgi:cytoplasmic iron level regulating protein YaaA (DUF328/UPF0246 family)